MAAAAAPTSGTLAAAAALAKWITAISPSRLPGYHQILADVPLWITFNPAEGASGYTDLKIVRVQEGEQGMNRLAVLSRSLGDRSVYMLTGTKGVDPMEFVQDFKIVPEDSHVPRGYQKLGRINPDALTDKLILLVSTVGSMQKIRNQEPQVGDRLDVLQSSGVWCPCTVEKKDEKTGALTMHVHSAFADIPPIAISEKQRLSPYRSKTLEIVHANSSVAMDKHYFDEKIPFQNKIHEGDFLGWLSFGLTETPELFGETKALMFLDQCLTFAIHNWEKDTEALILLHLLLVKTKINTAKTFGAFHGFMGFGREHTTSSAQTVLIDRVWKHPELQKFMQQQQSDLVQVPTVANRRSLLHIHKQWQIFRIFSEHRLEHKTSFNISINLLWTSYLVSVSMITDAELKDPITHPVAEKWIHEDVAPTLEAFHPGAHSLFECEWMYTLRMLSSGQLLRRCQAIESMVKAVQSISEIPLWLPSTWSIAWSALTSRQFLHETALKKALPLLAFAHKQQWISLEEQKQIQSITTGNEYKDLKADLQAVFSRGKSFAPMDDDTLKSTPVGIGQLYSAFRATNGSLHPTWPIRPVQTQLVDACLIQMLQATQPFADFKETRRKFITAEQITKLACQNSPNRRHLLTWYFQHHWKHLFIEPKGAVPAQAVQLGALAEIKLSSRETAGQAVPAFMRAYSGSLGQEKHRHHILCHALIVHHIIAAPSSIPASRNENEQEEVKRRDLFSNLEETFLHKDLPRQKYVTTWIHQVLSSARQLNLLPLMLRPLFSTYLHKPWQSAEDLWDEWMLLFPTEHEQRYVVACFAEIKNELVANRTLSWAKTLKLQETSTDFDVAYAIVGSFVLCTKNHSAMEWEQRENKKWYPRLLLETCDLGNLHGLSTLWSLASQHGQLVPCFLEFVVAVHCPRVVTKSPLYLAKRFALAQDFLQRVWKLPNVDTILVFLQQFRKAIQEIGNAQKLPLYLTLVTLVENSLVIHDARHGYLQAWRDWWHSNFAMPISWVTSLTISPPPKHCWWNQALDVGAPENQFRMALEVLLNSPWNSVADEGVKENKVHRRWGDLKSNTLNSNGWTEKITNRLLTVKEWHPIHFQMNDFFMTVTGKPLSKQLQSHWLVTAIKTKNWPALEKLLHTWSKWSRVFCEMAFDPIFFDLPDDLSEGTTKAVGSFFRKVLQFPDLAESWSLSVLRQMKTLPMMFYVLVNSAIRQNCLSFTPNIWSQLCTLTQNLNTTDNPARLFRALSLMLDTVIVITVPKKNAPGDALLQMDAKDPGLVKRIHDGFFHSLSQWLQAMMQHLCLHRRDSSLRDASVRRILNAIPVVFPMAGQTFQTFVLLWLQWLAMYSIVPPESQEQHKYFALIPTKAIVEKEKEDKQQSITTFHTEFKGMVNPSIFCYIISTTQQLYMIPEFRQLLSDIQAHTNNDLVQQLHLLFQQLNSPGAAVNPTPYINTLRDERGRPLNRNEQNDAHSYLTTLIDRLQLLVDGTLFGPRLHSLFSIGFTRTKRGQQCNHEAQSPVPPTSCLVVPIAGHKTLQDALSAYIRPEILQDPVFCDACQKRVPMTFVNTLDANKLPEYLLLQLNRTEGRVDSTGKNCARLEFPIDEALDMSKYCLQSQEGSKQIELQQSSAANSGLWNNYHLSGVVVHAGRLSGGHYFSLIRHKEQWYRFDDRVVTSVSAAAIPDMVYGGAPYNTGFLLFYKRTTNITETKSKALVPVPPPPQTTDKKKKEEIKDLWWYKETVLESVCDMYQRLPPTPALLTLAWQTWQQHVLTSTHSTQENILYWLKMLLTQHNASSEPNALIDVLRLGTKLLTRIRQRCSLDSKFDGQPSSELEFTFRELLIGQVKRWPSHPQIANLLENLIQSDLDPSTSIVFSEIGNRQLPWINRWRNVYPLTCQTWEKTHGYAQVLLNRLLMPPLSLMTVAEHLHISPLGTNVQRFEKPEKWSADALRRFVSALAQMQAPEKIRLDLTRSLSSVKKQTLGHRFLRLIVKTLKSLPPEQSSKYVKVLPNVFRHVAWNHPGNRQEILSCFEDGSMELDFCQIWPREAICVGLLKLDDECFSTRVESILRFWIRYFAGNSRFWQNMVVAQMAFFRCASVILENSNGVAKHADWCSAIARDLLRWWEKFPRADTSWLSQECGRTSDTIWLCRKEASYKEQYTSDPRHPMSPTEIRRVLLMIQQRISHDTWKDLVSFDNLKL